MNVGNALRRLLTQPHSVSYAAYDLPGSFLPSRRRRSSSVSAQASDTTHFVPVAHRLRGHRGSCWLARPHTRVFRSVSVYRATQR
jgi:hypothetical protein